MKRTLYLECYSGISGDMTVAALLDLGADMQVLNNALNSLPVHGFRTQVSRVKKAGLDACDFNVILDKVHENHDHDMNFLHGTKSFKVASPAPPSEHSVVERNTHSHEHRGLPEIIKIINQSNISQRAKKIALHTFEILAKAEAKAHGVEIEKVHFHEVGAVDSIVDIIAVAVCIDNLDITEVIVPVLYEGTGTVRCQHGLLPIPVPAVCNIISDNGLTMHITNTEGELVTPTGAAIVAALKTQDQLPEKFSVSKIGIGAGKRNYDRPSILRAMLLDYQSDAESDVIIKLESNIDDCSGEALGYVMDRLFEAGARDVHYIPVYMKKNRPAYQLNVICTSDKVAVLEQIIFEETTTIGIRRVEMSRSFLKRSVKEIDSSLGKAKIKQCKLKSGVRNYPEYESVIALCKKHNLSFQEVYQLILKECNEQ